MEYLKRIGRYVKSTLDRPMIRYPLRAYFYGLLIRYFIPPICAAIAHLLYACTYPFGSPERGTPHYHTFYVGGLDPAIERGYQYGVEHSEEVLSVLAGLWGMLYELGSWLARAQESEPSISDATPSSPDIKLSEEVSAPASDATSSSPDIKLSEVVSASVLRFTTSIPINNPAAPAPPSEPRKSHRRTQSYQY